MMTTSSTNQYEAPSPMPTAFTTTATATPQSATPPRSPSRVATAGSNYSVAIPIRATHFHILCQVERDIPRNTDEPHAELGAVISAREYCPQDARAALPKAVQGSSAKKSDGDTEYQGMPAFGRANELPVAVHDNASASTSNSTADSDCNHEVTSSSPIPTTKYSPAKANIEPGVDREDNNSITTIADSINKFSEAIHSNNSSTSELFSKHDFNEQLLSLRRRRASTSSASESSASSPEDEYDDESSRSNGVLGPSNEEEDEVPLVSPMAKTTTRDCLDEYMGPYRNNNNSSSSNNNGINGNNNNGAFARIHQMTMPTTTTTTATLPQQLHPTTSRFRISANNGDHQPCCSDDDELARRRVVIEVNDESDEIHNNNCTAYGHHHYGEVATPASNANNFYSDAYNNNNNNNKKEEGFAQFGEQIEPNSNNNVVPPEQKKAKLALDFILNGQIRSPRNQIQQQQQQFLQQQQQQQQAPTPMNHNLQPMFISPLQSPRTAFPRLQHGKEDQEDPSLTPATSRRQQFGPISSLSEGTSPQVFSPLGEYPPTSLMHSTAANATLWSNQHEVPITTTTTGIKASNIIESSLCTSPASPSNSDLPDEERGDRVVFKTNNNNNNNSPQQQQHHYYGKQYQPRDATVGEYGRYYYRQPSNNGLMPQPLQPPVKPSHYPHAGFMSSSTNPVVDVAGHRGAATTSINTDPQRLQHAADQISMINPSATPTKTPTAASFSHIYQQHAIQHAANNDDNNNNNNPLKLFSSVATAVYDDNNDSSNDAVMHFPDADKHYYNYQQQQQQQQQKQQLRWGFLGNFERLFSLGELSNMFGLTTSPKQTWRFRDFRRILFQKISQQHLDFIEKHNEHKILKQRLPSKLLARDFAKRICLLTFHFVLSDGKMPTYWKRLDQGVFLRSLSGTPGDELVEFVNNHNHHHNNSAAIRKSNNADGDGDDGIKNSPNIINNNNNNNNTSSCTGSLVDDIDINNNNNNNTAHTMHLQKAAPATGNADAYASSSAAVKIIGDQLELHLCLAQQAHTYTQEYNMSVETALLKAAKAVSKRIEEAYATTPNIVDIFNLRVSSFEESAGNNNSNNNSNSNNGTHSAMPPPPPVGGMLNAYSSRATTSSPMIDDDDDYYE